MSYLSDQLYAVNRIFSYILRLIALSVSERVLLLRWYHLVSVTFMVDMGNGNAYRYIVLLLSTLTSQDSVCLWSWIIMVRKHAKKDMII